MAHLAEVWVLQVGFAEKILAAAAAAAAAADCAKADWLPAGGQGRAEWGTGH